MMATLATTILALLVSVGGVATTHATQQRAQGNAGVFNVRACCGAKGDGHTDDTLAIRRAVAFAAIAGGTVLLPAPGTYVSGPLVLGNDTQLFVEAGATLLGSHDTTKYKPVWKRYDGAMALRPASLISAGGCVKLAKTNTSGFRHTGCEEWKMVRNVSITGGGVIDGGGQAAWAHEYKTRPTLVEPYWVDGFTVTDITLQNSPFWTFHPTFCNNVVAERVTILAPLGGNADGFDPDSCVGVIVRDSVANNGDDCVAINAGKYAGGVAIDMPTRDVLIDNLTCHTPISVGSGVSGGVFNVTVRNSRSVLAKAPGGCPSGPDCPVWFNTAFIIKNSRDRGGVVDGVLIQNHSVENADLVFKINQYYACQNHTGDAFRKCADAQPPLPGLTPQVHNVRFEDIRVVDHDRQGGPFRVGWLECVPEAPCTNISFANAMTHAQNGWACNNVQGTYTSTVTPPPTQTECKGLLPA
eukprot:m.33527 g.33527  ORF g.33527 m.33527 type:complete len:469 (-) comp10436_c0_seq1:77-1483(-)